MQTSLAKQRGLANSVSKSMIRATAETVTAYEKRTGFIGFGAFLVNRGELVICDESVTRSELLTSEHKAFPVGAA